MVRCTVKKLYCLCTENMWNHKRRQNSSVSSKKRDINLTRIEVGDIHQKGPVSCSIAMFVGAWVASNWEKMSRSMGRRPKVSMSVC